MPRGIVGKLGVKVTPDVTKFAKELREKLRKVRSQTDFDLPVGLVLDDGDVKQIQERLKRLDATVKVRVELNKESLKKAQGQIKRLDATVNAKVKIDEASLKQAKARIQGLGGARTSPKVKPKVEKRDLDALWKNFEGAETKVTPKIDGSGLSRMREQLKRQDWPTAEIKPHLDTRDIKNKKEDLDNGGVKIRLDIDEVSYRRVQERIKRLAEKVSVHLHLDESDYHKIKRKLGRLDTTATVNADADTGKARAKFMWLARTRFVKFVALADNAALRKVEDYFRRLSGFRALSDWSRAAKDMVMNLDQTALTMGVMGSAALSAAAAVTALVGSTLALAKGIASISPAALALPGVFLGMATGAVTLVASLKDAGERLKDIGEQFSQVKENFSNAFWAEAEGSIRSLASDAMPILDRQLSSLAAAQGQWTAAVADAVHSHLPQLEESLENTAEGARRSTRGFGAFTEGIVTLGLVGSKYLPMLGDWFSDLGEKFSAWAHKAASDGSIEAAITKAGQAARKVGAIMADFGRIVGGVFSAAEKGGYTMDRLVNTVDRFSKVVNSLGGQTVLTNLFAGAASAMDVLTAAVGKTGDDVVNFSFTVRRSMTDAAAVAGNAWIGLANILGSNAFGSGLSSFFIGLNEGVSKLRDAAPEISQLLGSVLTLGGSLASTVGGVLATAFEKLGPPVARLLTALAPLAEALGDWLVGAIEKVAPWFEKLVDKFLIPMIEKFTESPGLVIALVTAFWGFQKIVELASGLASIVNIVTSISSGIGALSAVFEGVALGPIALWAVAIVGLIAGLVLLWNNCESFRTAVTDIWNNISETIGNAIQVVVDWFVNDLQPAAEGLWQAFSDLWTTLGLPTFDSINAAIEFLQPIWEGFWNGLVSIVTGVWDMISGIVTGAIQILTGIIQFFIAFLTGDWGKAWEAVKNIVNGAISIITGIITGGVNIFLGVFQWFSTALSALWWGIIGAISGFASWIVNLLVNAARNSTYSAARFFADFPNKIKGFFADAGSWLVSAGHKIIDGFINAVRGAFGRVRSTFGALTRMIPHWKGPEPTDRTLLKPAGRMIIQGFVSGIEEEQPTVKHTLRRLTGGLPGMTVNHEVAGGGFTKPSTSVTINQYNPVQEPDSSIRDKVASGIRLAASL